MVMDKLDMVLPLSYDICRPLLCKAKRVPCLDTRETVVPNAPKAILHCIIYDLLEMLVEL